MDPPVHHPWDVSNLEEFHFYCCPECDLKEHAKDRFVKHALENHTESKQHLGKLLIKQEIHPIHMAHPVDEDEKKFFEKKESDCVTIKEEFQQEEEYEDYNDNEFINVNENVKNFEEKFENYETFDDDHGVLQDEFTPLRKMSVKVTSKYAPYYDIGKNKEKHALKIYKQFTLDILAAFGGSTGSNITPVVQFYEIFVTKIMNKLIYYDC